MASGLGYDAPAPGSWQQVFEPEAQAAIRQSAAALARDQVAFTKQLHSDVTSLIPESAVPPGFDMWAFCERMAQALLWLALADQPPRVAFDALRQLGGQNWYAGFPESQYSSIAHALIQTVHYLGANSWTTSTGSSWISFFMWVQPYLLAGAKDAVAHEAAARDAAAREAAREAAAQRAAADQEAVSSPDPRRTQPNAVYNNLHRVGPFANGTTLA